MAASFLFGPVAGGVITGINFGRLGKQALLTPSILLGVVAFLIEAALLVFLVPERAARPVGMLMNIGMGCAFLLWQKPTFEQWKARHWKPASANAKYKPNRIGLLFLAGLGCLAAQAGVIFLMMWANGEFA